MEETPECPLCMETLELDDVNFFPCSCGYQICRFCWHRIRTDENGLCPACRQPYSENPAVYTPLTQEQIQKVKSSKRRKMMEKRQKAVDGRKQLAELRVVQRNLVFVIGLSPRLADAEMLKKHEYFGKFGKIHKIVVNSSNIYPGPQGPSLGAYITYYKNEDAAKAIHTVNDSYVDGRFLKATFGTTKYCSNFLRNQPCHKPDCMYLHEMGDEEASFTKEDMQLGRHQTFEMLALSQYAKDTTASKSQPKDMETDASMGAPVGGAVASSVGVISPPSSGLSSSGLTSYVTWGEGDNKQVGKPISKVLPTNQASEGAAEMETEMPSAPNEEAMCVQDIGAVNSLVEQDKVNQGNSKASASACEAMATAAEPKTESTTSSGFGDMLSFGRVFQQPVQNLLSDMNELTLSLNYERFQEQLRQREQQQKQALSPGQELEQAEDDALLRDAVEEAAQMLGRDRPVSGRTSTSEMQNGIGEASGQECSWLWQVEEDNSTRPLNWNDEDDLEFDPYGESSKGLAEIMEAEKRRVVNGVRESLRNEQQYAEQEQQYAEKEQQSAQQEQPYSQEQHVPLWRRRGSNAEATIQSHAQAHAQAAQAQAHAQAQAAQAQAQTHALNQINQAQAEAAQAQAAQAQAAQAQCLPQSHMPGQVYLVNPNASAGHLRPHHTPGGLPSNSGQSQSLVQPNTGPPIMALHVQQPPMNGMWHNRVQKPGEGLLIQGPITVPGPTAGHMPLRPYPDHHVPLMSSAQGHMPGLPAQNYVWPESQPSMQPPPPPTLPGPPYHNLMFALPGSRRHSRHGRSSAHNTPGQESQRVPRPRHLASPRQESVAMYAPTPPPPPPGPAHYVPQQYVQSTIQHQVDPYAQYQGMSVHSLAPPHHSRHMRPPPGIHVRPEHSQAVPYYMNAMPNPMDPNGAMRMSMNMSMNQNPTC